VARVTVTHSETHPVAIDRIEAALAGAHEVRPVELPPGSQVVGPTEPFRAAVAESDALVMRPGRVTAAVLDGASALRIVAVHGSGYDHVDVAAATERGVIVTHSPEAVAPSVVEHTVGLALALTRDWPAAMVRAGTGEWRAARDTVTEVGELTVGVVGLGTIGLGVARALGDAFGPDLVGHDPYVTGERTAPDAPYPRHDRATVEAAGVELVGLAAAFERADLVTLHVPLTATSRGLVGAAELARLDGGALINTARGEILDEAALAAALDAGDVGRAALDVRDPEPPAADDELAGRSDVVVTPHVAGVSDAYLRRGADRAAAKVSAALGGERPDGVVDPTVLG
jgi:phosphoglycerate dehydrogenase-like enzyme